VRIKGTKRTRKVCTSKKKNEVVAKKPGATSVRGLYCSLLEQWFQTDAAGIIPSAASFARPVLIG